MREDEAISWTPIPQPRRIAAVVLFCSGVLIGCTLGRVSAWIIPPQHSPQVASKTSPPAVASSARAVVAAPDSRPAIAAKPAPLTDVTPPKPPLAEEHHRALPEEIKTDEAKIVPPAPSPSPPVVLLNPGLPKDSPPERTSKSSSTKMERRYAPDLPETQASADARERPSRQSDRQPDYKSLREDMLRR
jgi:hypothetical protein